MTASASSGKHDIRFVTRRQYICSGRNHVGDSGSLRTAAFAGRSPSQPPPAAWFSVPSCRYLASSSFASSA